MTRSDLIDKVSKRAQDLTKKQVEIIVETVFESIREALSQGEKVEIRGFGNFRLKKRRPKKGRNPKTGEAVDVPSKSVVYFKVGKELREAVNKH